MFGLQPADVDMLLQFLPLNSMTEDLIKRMRQYQYNMNNTHTLDD